MHPSVLRAHRLKSTGLEQEQFNALLPDKYNTINIKKKLSSLIAYTTTKVN